MRLGNVVVAVVLAAATAVPPAAATAGDASAVVRARFTATMPDRFGLDADRNGLIDLPNSAEYVNPGVVAECDGDCAPRFVLRLDAGLSTATLEGAPLRILTYRWEIDGPGGTLVRRTETTPVLEVDLPEGRYQVVLQIEALAPRGPARGRFSRQVTVADVLVVAMGDSYAAGEGNPERGRGEAGSAAWGDAPGDPIAAARHAAAHRSTAAWPALVALALELADPGTSVTFVSVAASGARIEAGLLAPQPQLGVAGQIAQAAGLVGDRPIDLLLISVGGNDIGFSHIARGLVDADRLADPVCYGTDLQNVWDAAWDGDWNRGSRLRFALPWGVGCRSTRTSGRPLLPGLSGLPGELSRLAAALEAELEVGAVFLMEYPDPTGAGTGAILCREIVGDVTPPFGFHEIDRAEQEQGLERVVRPLNAILQEAAARHGWGFVGGVAEAFSSGHGYCGTRPQYPPAGGESAPWGTRLPSPPPTDLWYRHPAWLEASHVLSLAGVSWYRTAAQSVALQGPGAAWDTAGTLHPNELGHLAIARLLLGALAGD